LGEIKILSEDELLLFDEELMGWCMGNAITMQDTNGNRKLLKKRRELKVDSVAALIDAYIAYKAHKDLYD
jgi:phage terminase large subunit-like protein